MPETAPQPAAAPSSDLHQFVAQLAQFFSSETLLQVDWASDQKAHVTDFKPGSGVASTPQLVETNALIPWLPLADAAFDTVFNLASLNRVNEANLAGWLKELYRLTSQNLWVVLEAEAGRGRAWWETKFFEAGFRKHPRSQEILPYESIEQENCQITLIFDKIPAVAIARYPITALKAERDLHMDMLRESGRRSDAHIARYVLAKNYIRPNTVVVDAACGLGYGSAVMAQAGGPSVRVVGLDNSAYAVDYARLNFATCLPNTDFEENDVCDLSRFADNTVDLVVSFETVEHLREPGVFLREVKRVLKPGGRFVCSVPNLWVDETGEDPNPWHFHVFDFPRIAAFCQEQLDLQEVFAQTAGGGMKCNALPCRMRQVNLPYTQSGEDVEWWVAIAGKPVAAPDSLTRSTQGRRAVVMATDPKHSLYQSWLGRCPVPYEVLNPGKPGARVPTDALLLITHDTYTEPGRSLVRKAVADGVPTLILADGMLEYRNTFEHPQLDAGAVFQPVLGHKIATISQAQSEIIESWGNSGKCETVGLPRLDRYYGIARRQRQIGEPCRILIGTALTPFFTGVHRRQVLASLCDLKAFFSQTPACNGTRLEPVWRLTQGLAEEIGVSSVINDYSGRELAELLLRVDAVISTPSTTMLEAMMLGLPVAVLDYCNAPHYVATAWRITAPGQIADTVVELVNPVPAKLLFQETMLHRELQCITPATPRLLELITRMAEEAIRARDLKRQPDYSTPLLPIPRPQPVENRFSSELHEPGLKSGGNRDHSAIQSSEESNHVATSARAIEVASGFRTAQMKGAAKQLQPVALTALLDFATNAASEGHKMLTELLLEEALESTPGSKPALELQQESQAAITIKQQTNPEMLLPAARTEAPSGSTVTNLPAVAQQFKADVILFVSHEASRTGAPIYLLHLLRWLRAKTNLQLRVLLGRGGPLESKFRAVAETFTPETFGTDGSRLADVNLIYSNTCTNGTLINSLGCGDIPIVTHVHELDCVIEIFGRENFENVRNHTRQYIACSQAVANALTQRYQIRADRITVHHEMISVAEVALRSASNSPQVVRTRYGLPDNAFVIAACGAAEWRKGPDLFLQLASALHRRYSSHKVLRFVWIGPLPNDGYDRALRYDSARLGWGEVFQFVGEQENPHELLKACDLFCLPSREDPFPLVMLEAAALGKAFVCFDGSGGAKEFAERGAGFAVPYLDVSAMVEQCVQLIENEQLCQRTGMAAAQLVREDFDVEVSAPRVWECLQSIFQAFRRRGQRAVGLRKEYELLLRRGDRPGALTCLEQLVELAPDDLELALSVGNLHYEVGHLAAAAEQFERATKLTPQQATAHALLASLRVQQERLVEAEASARRALELEPLRLDMLRLLSALTRHAERFAEAGAYYASIVRLSPQDLDARLGQAVCSAALGHRVLAELILEEVFELQPDHPEALALRAQLNGKHESGAVTVESSQLHLPDRLHCTAA